MRPVVFREIDQAEEDPPRDALDPVLAAGERRLQAEEVEHLGQGQGDHREVDPLPADGQRARRPARAAPRSTIPARMASSGGSPTPWRHGR